jgi:DNA polymerase delta subunit 1
VVLQVRDTLGALAQRFAELRLDAGGLHISRLSRAHSSPVSLKRIVMYSPAWVKSQNRMASTSNQVPPIACPASGKLGPGMQPAVHLSVGYAQRPCSSGSFKLKGSSRESAGVSVAWGGPGNKAGASEQETFRMENAEGRVVLDTLRHALTACNLASFSLVDCCQSLLGRRLEVLPHACVAHLSSCASASASAMPPALHTCCCLCVQQITPWYEKSAFQQSADACQRWRSSYHVGAVEEDQTDVPAALLAELSDEVLRWGGADGAEQAAGRMRLAAHAADRVGVVRALLRRLATLPEAIEIGRVTGLTLGQARLLPCLPPWSPRRGSRALGDALACDQQQGLAAQVLYNAQMIRTWSLLLRNAQRLNYIVSGRQDALPLSESPYLMHPVETGNVGLYKNPVAILDFASLYPSLYRAYNLCYSTLLHPEDASTFPPEHITVTPTGAGSCKAVLMPPRSWHTWVAF